MYEIGICSKCHQEKPIFNKAEKLCRTCYNILHDKVGICSECNREKSIKNKSLNLCSACYARRLRSRPGYVKKQRIGICSRCHRERPLVTKSDLCNSCHVIEYKRRTGYKGPVRACVACGKVTNIHSNNMCKPCYDKKYAEDNHDRILENKRRNRASNPEKFRKWDRDWKQKNRALINARGRKRYWDNIDESRAKRREYYYQNKEEVLKRLREKYILNNLERDMTPEEVLQEEVLNNYIDKIPDLKKIWVVEFLDGVYKDKAYKTKRKFLQDMNRLLSFVKKNNTDAYLGGWNMLSLVDVERCQVETGPLKDSLRIFFRWLKKRKYVVVSLEEAIKPGTRAWLFAEITIDNLSDLVKSLYNGSVNLEMRIAGLMIVFFLCTNQQLRYLEVSHLKNQKIYLNGRWQDVDGRLWTLIEEYKTWRDEFYLGYAPKYFFVTGYTVGTGRPVSIDHFADLFNSNNLGITPSKLRKAMIFFHKEKTGMDPFALGAIAGIQPRSATRY